MRERLGGGQAADLAEAMLAREAHAHAYRAAGTPFDLAVFRRHLGTAVAEVAPNHAAERLRTLGVTFVQARPAFADARTLIAGSLAIRARRFALATGGRPALPTWAAGLEPDLLLRPATLALRPALPGHVAVVADNPEGFVWAQILRRLGATVTLIAAPGAAGGFDLELVRPLLSALRRDGVTIAMDRTVERGDGEGGGLSLCLDHAGGGGAVEATHAMIAGRPAPALAGLALDRAGVLCAEGRPLVDDRLRTRNPRVFALGDVLGRGQPGGAAIPHQVGLVLRAALFRLPVRDRPERVPISLPTDPPLAQVGELGRAPAGEGHGVLRVPLSETMRGAGPAASDGGVAVAVTRRGRVLGAGAVGAGAPETIALWSMMLGRGLPLGILAGLPLPATPLVEASRRVGVNHVAAQLGSRWGRRLLALLRRLP